jgi:polyribonucleotide nucleotidyltransferase
MLNLQNHRYSVMVGKEEIIIETGKLAGQAGGAVTARIADTVIFAAATMSPHAREGIDFFPLQVEYEEKLYAAGRIPGSFFRREGRPSDSAILVSRVIDRPLRPLFSEEMRNEVQVLLTPFSHDQEHQIDMLGLIAASTALTISDIPWNGPVAGVRIGLIDGEFVINPVISEMDNSSLDLRVAGTAEAINMVECGATEVDEETMLKALKLAHETIKPIIELQNKIRAEIGKPKKEIKLYKVASELFEEVASKTRSEVRRISVEITDRAANNAAIEEVREKLVAEYEERNKANTDPAQAIKLSDVREALMLIIYEEVRKRIVHDGVRPDGRDSKTIRPLAAEVGLIPRVHGTGLFTRGQTQVLTFATLGTPRDAQQMDGLSPEEDRRYMHHYNMPPFSTGETYPIRGPKRREIGHGALAENALRPMIPPEDEFPYTIRLVSEVLSSNGSTSMASVCGSTLALMDAGVPIIRPVAGIAMGLIQHDDKTVVLTDIQGMEDHFGDMDFKVAGTVNGITALQMDIKISGVTDEVMAQALAQAKDARMQILDLITKTIPEPRPELSEYAPRMVTVKIDQEKIGAVIGQGGKVVRSLQDRLGVKIDIEDDGTIFVAGNDGPSVQRAVDEIRGLTEDAEIGTVYTGRVTRIESYGAFVEFLPGKEGMVHISQLADYKVASVQDEVALGDEIMVMVTDIDDSGKVRLSRQAVLEGWTAEEARSRDRRPSGGGDRGGNRGGGGYNRGGGGDRGGNRGGGDRGGNRGGGRDGGGDRGPRR